MSEELKGASLLASAQSSTLTGGQVNERQLPDHLIGLCQHVARADQLTVGVEWTLTRQEGEPAGGDDRDVVVAGRLVHAVGIELQHGRDPRGGPLASRPDYRALISAIASARTLPSR